MRVNKKDLEQLVNRLNEIKGYSVEPYAKNPDTGKHEPQPFNYHLYWAYGGVALDQFGASGSGTRRISHDGCGTKNQLYSFLTAYIDGLEAWE
jgi:hypothetical protein